MRSSRVVLLAVTLGFVGLEGCYFQERRITVDATYEAKSDSTIAPVPSGTLMVIQCIDAMHNVTSRTTMYSEHDDGEGRFFFFAIGITNGNCKVWDIELPGEYGETDVYECDPIESENCEFELPVYGGDYYVGEIHFTPVPEG
jgi:hypothetical protein